MAKNKAAKRREVAGPSAEELEAARALAEREKATSFVLAMVWGAAFSALALWSVRWGAQELWAPFEVTGKVTLGCLLVSALVGGAVAGVAGRGAPAPLPAGACALGWALWAMMLHTSASGKFVEFSGKGSLSRGELQNEVVAILARNNIYQPLAVVAGLLVASLAGWVAGRFFYPAVSRAESTRDVTQRDRLRSNFISFALISTIAGFLLLWAMSFLPFRVLPPLYVQNLPAKLAPALLCGMTALAAFAIVSYSAARFYRRRGGILAYLAAPLVVLMVGLVLQRPDIPPLRSMLTVMMFASPFEIACWGAFGAVAGFWIRELNRD